MRILILQYLQPKIDPLALEDTERSYYLGLISRFYPHHVRFRLHPESKARPEYIVLATERRLRAPEFDDENRPLRKSMEWPDLVIVPAFSGAALEAIGSGKRTFLVLLPPHSQEMRYFRGARIYETLEAVHHAFRAGVTPDHSEFFERYTSRKEIPDPRGMIWAVLS